MDTEQFTTTAKNVEELFKIVMKLYWDYLGALERLIRQIPDTETDFLNELAEHMREVQKALEHDISIFQNAISSDIEDLHKVADRLKIDTIYKQLKQ